MNTIVRDGYSMEVLALSSSLLTGVRRIVLVQLISIHDARGEERATKYFRALARKCVGMTSAEWDAADLSTIGDAP